MTEIADVISSDKGKATVCKSCSKRHNLRLDPDRTITTKTIVQSKDDKRPCTICGLNVYGMFADDVITGEKPLAKDLMTERETPFESLATVVDNAWTNTMPMKESEGTVESEVTDGVRWVTSDTTAKERLVIEVDVSSDSVSQTADEIQQFLESCGFNITREGGPDENYLWLVAEL